MSDGGYAERTRQRFGRFVIAEVAVEDCRVRKVVAVEVNVGPRRESRVVVAEPELCFVRGGAIPDEMGCGRMPEAVEANPGSARIRVLTPFTRLVRQRITQRVRRLGPTCKSVVFGCAI